MLEPEELKGSESGESQGKTHPEPVFLAAEGRGEKKWGGRVGGRRGNRRL